MVKGEETSISSRNTTAHDVAHLPVRRAAMRSLAPLIATECPPIVHHSNRIEKETTGVETMAVHRGGGSTDEPEDLRHCGSDKPVDTAGDGRPGVDAEGELTMSLTCFHEPYLTFNVQLSPASTSPTCP